MARPSRSKRSSILEFIMEYERRAKQRGNRVYKIYARLPEKKKAIADKILDELAEGKLTYEQVLKKLKELAR